MVEGKWIPGLGAEMPVAEAAGLVLAARLEAVRHLLPLATQVAYPEVESIHQLRVSTRRAGAALRVFSEGLPRKHYRSARRALRTLRRAAGDARDWDVFLLGLTASKPLMRAASRPALDFLTGYALGERAAAQSRLTAAADLAGPDLEAECRALPELVLKHPPESPASFGNLAAAQFGTLLENLDEQIPSKPADPAALHRLRIAGKRARYALEIFASCFSPACTDSLYPAFENLQEILGGFQDAMIGIERFGSLRNRVRRSAARKQWPRLRAGFEGQTRLLRAQAQTARKAFQKWRKEWRKLSAGLKLEVVSASGAA